MFKLKGKNANSTFINDADIEFIHDLPLKEKEFIDYHIPEGEGKLSLSKHSLLPGLYAIRPSPYPLTEKEIRNILEYLAGENEKQLFTEILRAYAYGAYIPALISCRSLLETIIDNVCSRENINLSVIQNSGALRPKWLAEKIKDLKIGAELENFMLFNNHFANKAVHEIFTEYERVFDKTKTTILLGCTLLIINEIKQKYDKRPATNQ